MKIRKGKPRKRIDEPSLITIRTVAEDYERLRDLVAENPGINRQEILEEANSRGIEDTADLLDQALTQEDILCYDGRHWIMRKGRFSYDQYDHPEP